MNALPLVERLDGLLFFPVTPFQRRPCFDGPDAGPVRAPLAAPKPEHVERLRALVETGRGILAGSGTAAA